MLNVISRGRGAVIKHYSRSSNNILHSRQFCYNVIPSGAIICTVFSGLQGFSLDFRFLCILKLCTSGAWVCLNRPIRVRECEWPCVEGHPSVLSRAVSIVGDGNGTTCLTSGVRPNLSSAALVFGFWLGMNSKSRPKL